MSITHDTTHAASALEQLLSQFADSLNLLALMGLIADAVQDVENLAYALESDFLDLSGAEGVQLDTWGRILGLAREGLTDEAYRRLLAAWPGALRSQGITDRITTAAAALLEQSDIIYRRIGEAAYSLEWEQATATNAAMASALERVLEAASPSGVAYQAIEGTTTAPGPFRFDTAGQGFDEGLLSRRVV